MFFEFVLETTKFLKVGIAARLGYGACGMVIGRDQLALPAESVGDDVEDRPAGDEGDILIEPGRLDTRSAPDLAGVGDQFVVEDSKQR